MHSIDQELSEYFDFFLLCSLSVIVSFGTITFVTPWFGVAVVPILIVYVVVLNYFREVARETKRLDSISRSPVYAHFSETLGGLATIRAYGASERFVAEFVEKLDGNTRTYYCNKSADRWLSVRLEMIGALVAGLAAVFSSSMVVSGTAGSNFASLAGLSLTSAISVTGLLNWCVRSFAQLEAGMNSSERVLHYTENIPQEAPATSADLEKRAAATVASSVSSEGTDAADEPSAFAVRSSGGKALYPDADWPSNGAIELNDLHMRYRSGTPLVLKGLNVSISGGERIGVVGRTGSGKSSLLLNLMRIVEPDLTPRSDDDAAVSSYSPPIVIDGVDVLRVGLDDLRSKLGIIPQNPVLFSGTIRSNLDPFDEYEDKELWSALDGCGMRAAVEAMPDGLSGTVAEYGDNLSQGQRQLLCLGRALLRKCRVLLLDEATSSVDFETDREIQRTLREAFEGSTIITIAHRVNTIMDSDKILVMKDGKVAEFAPPKELLSDERSFFSEIVRHAEAEHH
uniref:ABC transporter domain-containing protein n=2 Tax=Pseudictyota dubia TaxID=2749911 RepID=A0A7R9WD62_9STRA